MNNFLLCAFCIFSTWAQAGIMLYAAKKTMIEEKSSTIEPLGKEAFFAVCFIFYTCLSLLSLLVAVYEKEMILQRMTLALSFAWIFVLFALLAVKTSK